MKSNQKAQPANQSPLISLLIKKQPTLEKQAEVRIATAQVGNYLDDLK